MMYYKLFVLSLIGVVVIQTNGFLHENRTADHDLLVRQKQVFDLLMYVDQNVLHDAEYFEIGRHYDIMSNIDHYNNREFVMEFMSHWNVGMLQRDALFSYYNQEHREELMMLYRLFYFARDYNTFYKTACWARIHMNPGMFTIAFTTAVVYRDDTRFIQLPAIYEIYPHLFFDSATIRDAHRIAMTRGSTHYGFNVPSAVRGHLDTVETHHIYSNATSFCHNMMYHPESVLDYFTQDASLNSYYYYFRMMFPFWMNSREYNVPKQFRGELYLWLHQQLMARYNLERMSNHLEEVSTFSWEHMHLPGFYNNYMFSNGWSMPRRDWWNAVPYYKQRYFEYLQNIEGRIMDAVDSGFVIDEQGKQISISTNEGLNILGNLIEGNFDSINLKYYGSYDALARFVLGENVESHNKNFFVPSSMQIYGTSMKDPAFYRMYARIMDYYFRYKSLLPRYTRNQLGFNGVRIENVEVDKIVTYFDTKEYLINNAVAVPTMKIGRSFNIKTWQYYLNYKPFNYRINVNSDRSTKAVVRIFLGPAEGGENYNDYSYLLHYYKYFWMLDEFEVNLNEGMNNINRLSTDSPFFMTEHATGDQYYRRILQGLEGREPVTFNNRRWGFPAHLMLPRGNAGGMRFKLFFHIDQMEGGKVMDLPIFGRYMYYGRPLGYPLDRPMQPWFMNLSNVFFKDVHIYNQMNYEMCGQTNYNRLMYWNDMIYGMNHNYNDMSRWQSSGHAHFNQMQGGVHGIGDNVNYHRWQNMDMIHV